MGLSDSNRVAARERASPSLLDHADFPSRFAIALDQPIGDPDSGQALTFRLTPLSLAALLGAGRIGFPPGDSARCVAWA
jgi:hypothetical protein